MVATNGKPIRQYDYKPKIKLENPDPKSRNPLLDEILDHASKDSADTNIFHIMDKRRSTRKFTDSPIEDIIAEEIIAAADTAPTAGNFQGFEIFYIKNPDVKKELVSACNDQNYVNAPLVLVFCKNPDRMEFNFSDYTLKKFAIQDATLAAGYSQLAAHALGLSTIWIGMFNEQKVKDAIRTDLTPSSILCIGYPQMQRYPKRRRNLDKLVHVIS